MFPVAILAGGLGTRLRPVTETIPKALVPVLGRPFVYHQLELLRAKGVTDVTVCVSHLGEMIVDAVGNGSKFGLSITYSFDGEQRVGTAGAVRRALPSLGNKFFTLYGDSYLDCDFTAVQAAFESYGKPGLMTVYKNDDKLAPSNARLCDNLIQSYDKANPRNEMSYIDYGLSVFDRTAFLDVSDREPTDLAAVYQRLIAKSELAAYEVSTRFYEVGSLEGVAVVEQILSRR